MRRIYCRYIPTRLSGLMVMGFFQQKSEFTKVSYRSLKKFEKKMPKKFDQSESWKIEFHFRHENYIPFEIACSTEFKTVLGLKISYVVLEKFWVKNRKLRKNDDFLRKRSDDLQFFIILTWTTLVYIACIEKLINHELYICVNPLSFWPSYAVRNYFRFPTVFIISRILLTSCLEILAHCSK